MTQHEADLLDGKIAELNKALEALERLRGEVNALQRRGNREQAFFAGRRSMAYELRESGGLTSGRLGMEILYLLPDDFVQFYGSLFHRALNIGDSSVNHGRSGGLDKAPGVGSGMVTGSDNRLQAQSSGKRFRNTPMHIGSERMLKLKQRLDGELIRLTRDYTQAIGLEGSAHGEVGGSSRSPGNGAVRARQCVSETCRRFLKAEWKFCPGCGTQVE